jgi:uncharacterized protein YggE
MATNGELYVFKDGEQEAIAQANELIKQALDKLHEARDILRNAEKNHYYDTLELWIDKDYHNDDQYRLLSNYNTTMTITVRVDDQWMSSDEFC